MYSRGVMIPAFLGVESWYEGFLCHLCCDLYCDLSKATYFCYLPLPRLGLSGRLRSASSLGPHHDMRSDKKRLVPDEGATSPTQKPEALL